MVSILSTVSVMVDTKERSCGTLHIVVLDLFLNTMCTWRTVTRIVETGVHGRTMANVPGVAVEGLRFKPDIVWQPGTFSILVLGFIILFKHDQIIMCSCRIKKAEKIESKPVYSNVWPWLIALNIFFYMLNIGTSYYEIFYTFNGKKHFVIIAIEVFDICFFRQYYLSRDWYKFVWLRLNKDNLSATQCINNQSQIKHYSTFVQYACDGKQRVIMVKYEY